MNDKRVEDKHKSLTYKDTKMSQLSHTRYYQCKNVNGEEWNAVKLEILEEVGKVVKRVAYFSKLDIDYVE